MREVIIVADDLGVCEERNRGILRCIETGIVTRTSIMVNGPAAVDAVEIFHEKGLMGTVGLHLNLTEGKPISDPELIPSLVIKQDQGAASIFRGKLGFREACARGQVLARDVEREARAQVDWFRGHVGTAPRHVDGHQHCHVSAATRDVLTRVFVEANIEYVRTPSENQPVVNELCAVCSTVGEEAQEVIHLTHSTMYSLVSPL